MSQRSILKTAINRGEVEQHVGKEVEDRFSVILFLKRKQPRTRRRMLGERLLIRAVYRLVRFRFKLLRIVLS